MEKNKNTHSQKKLIHEHLKKNKIYELHRKFKYRKSHYTKKFTKNTIQYSLIVLFFYLAILYLMFFVFHIDADEQNLMPAKLKTLTSIEQVKIISNLSTYQNYDSAQSIQPINIIIITSNSPEKLFENINWERNEMFNSDKITLRNYFELFKNKSLPISTNYLNGNPQDFAFQEKSNSNLDREHIRLWKVAYYNNESTVIYLGSVSYDKGIDFSIYHDFLVPLHEFDPNVDKSRDYLTQEFILKSNPKRYYNLSSENILYEKLSDKHKYFSDGNIAVLEFD